jgi:hypothetical protein
VARTRPSGLKATSSAVHRRGREVTRTRHLPDGRSSREVAHRDPAPVIGGEALAVDGDEELIDVEQDRIRAVPGVAEVQQRHLRATRDGDRR